MKSVLGYLNPMNVMRLKGPSAADRLYEVINFEFEHEHLIWFDKYNNINEEDQYEMGDSKMDEVEEIYLSHYDILKEVKEAKNNFIEYEVKNNDTIYGLELKFQMSVKQILEINQISEDLIVTGVKLKLPHSARLLQLIQEDELDVEVVGKSYLGRNLMDEIMLNKPTRKYSVCYISNIGNIQGTLTINEDIILFDPFFNDANKNLSPLRLEGQILKYQSCVCFKDIQSAEPITLPTRISGLGSSYYKDYVVQMILKGVGRKRGTPVRDSVKSPMGAIYFKVFQNNDLQPDWSLQEAQCIEICDQINELAALKRAEECKLDDDEITFVPFYDTTWGDTQQTINMLLERSSMMYGGSAYIPKLEQQSKILPHEQFIQILCNIPSVFRCGNWKVVYQNQLDGSSLNTLLTRSENMTPQILIIRDFEGHCFGAYLSDYIRMNHGGFYGTGETFLFTFMKNNTNIKIYNWTNTNQDFMYCDQDGVGVGCGEKYGIYLSGDLSKGYTSPCDTFQNELLTQQEDFQVDLIELWSLNLY